MIPNIIYMYSLNVRSLWSQFSAASRKGAETVPEDDPLVRFGITMECDLLERVDRLVEARGLASRSAFFRRLARTATLEDDFENPEGELVGTLTIVYSHDRINPGQALTSLQHEALHCVTATLHIHLDEGNCLEVLALKGASREIRELSRRLESLRGIKTSSLCLAAPAGRDEDS